jgi:23S rRNA U2552 (ribose-2'-O)-methylase RlmE/FtsJ
MQRIGEEIHNTTMGLATRTVPGTILDMCVAPGGFLATAKRLNPGAEVMGFSLPPSDGGYSVLLPEDQQSSVTFLDITMLAADMGVTNLPEGHQDIGNFLPRQFGETQLFELVVCDGQVLRTHTREPSREAREPTRLKTVQLALGLEHMKPGGTILVLFHKLESWDTACYVRKFSEFSSVRLFKPRAGHATRSSFYMVASNVQSQHPNALLAVEKWKAVWRAATFGSEEEFIEALCDAGPSAEKLLEEFGSELVNHGREIWLVQAQALARASFVKG